MSGTVAVLCSLACAIVFSIPTFAQQTISAVRAMPPGAVVTIEGVVLNGEELGGLRFLQDSTAGIAIFPGSGSASGFGSSAQRAVKMEVTGVLKTFQGLLEINPVLNFKVIADNEPLPEPLEITLDQVGPETEGMLVRVPCIGFPGPIEMLREGQVRVFDNTGLVSSLFFDADNPLPGYEIQDTVYSITGISSRAGQPQLLPRDEHDISFGDCFHILHGYDLLSIGKQTLTFTFLSSEPANGGIVYQHATGVMDTTLLPGLYGQHFVTIDGLQPATWYTVRAIAQNADGEWASTPVTLESTASLNDGEIRVYFNDDIDASFSDGSSPETTTGGDLLNALIDEIENATETIDVALYSNGRFELVDALKQAHQRGVRVRYITDEGPSNSALNTALPFQVMTVAGEGLMHNKFFILDAGNPDEARVWTGSTNFSTNQVFADPNNSVLIRDHALTRAYAMEFEEMWGSNTAMPNFQDSRRGAEKTDNTPHLFNVNGRRIELYFSPSDNTEYHIDKVLRTSDADIMAGLLLLTRDGLAETLVREYQEGSRVRVITDDEDQFAEPYQILRSGGVKLRFHDQNEIFHHKYAIIDPEKPDSDPYSADHINDENTLIIHDPGVANIFQQEFEARWAEFGTSVREEFPVEELRVYPNPAGDFVSFILPAERDDYKVSVFDIHGQVVVEATLSGEGRMVVSSLPPGPYQARITSRDTEFLARFVKLP